MYWLVSLALYNYCFFYNNLNNSFDQGHTTHCKRICFYLIQCNPVVTLWQLCG